MRTIIALLLLGAATPALAAADPGDRHGWQSRSGQQSTSDSNDNRSDGGSRQRSDRGNRGNGSANDAPSPPPPQQQQQRDHPRAVMHVESPSDGHNGQAQPATQVESNNSGGNARDHRQFNGFRNRVSGGDEPRAIEPSGRNDGTDTVRSWRGPKIVEPTRVTTDDRATLRDQRRPLPNVLRNRVPIVSNVPHEGTQPPLRADGRSRDRNHHWDTRWRDNNRYDWQDWRRHHRSHFHLGLYFDPFGWGYQPWQIGWRLWPNYYSSRYWINDPFDYRLPYAPPGYRWIRYWDDAILVDTFTGEAVDVIRNFFW
ncbi:MAG TPA: RcnB family protein [Sphingomicrobium sp.]|nr:RcnB family protein [Sphingomicrobium sp.]